MGFFMDGLDAEAYDRSYKDSQLVQRIIKYFKPKLPLVIIVTLLVVLNSCFDSAFPILVSQSLNNFVDANIVWQTAIWLVGFILLASIILIAGILSWTCNLFRQWFTAQAVGDVVLQLRKDAFTAVMSRDMSFFDEFSSGKIVSRVTSDTDNFATVVTLILNLLSQVLLFLIIVGVLFFKNVQLALLTLIITPVIMAVALGFRRLARSLTRRSQRSLARVNANIQESVSGITVAKSFRQEQNMYDEFKQINKQSYDVNLKTGFLYNGVFPVLVLIANFGTTIVVYFGGQNVLNHSISAGDWFLFVQSLSLLWLPLTSIASFWSQFQLGLAASERVFALLDAEPRVVQSANDTVPELAGKIEFKDVLFSYDQRQTVLPRFNLVIQAGETVAFVGHTGAGKSSLVRISRRSDFD